jgi:hypothetical protein
LAVNYTHKEEFAAAGYAPFKVDGTEYGEVRQFGNFSFVRMYEVSLCIQISEILLLGHLR